MASNLAALDAAEPYACCVIGSGPAGTVLGTRWLFKPTLKRLDGLFDPVGATDREEIEITWSRHHQGELPDARRSAGQRLRPGPARARRAEPVPRRLRDLRIGSAVPPTLTIVALVHRLADHLIARARRGEVDRSAPALAA
jgi:hypothetical protein